MYFPVHRNLFFYAPAYLGRNVAYSFSSWCYVRTWVCHLSNWGLTNVTVDLQVDPQVNMQVLHLHLHARFSWSSKLWLPPCYTI